MRVLVVGIIYEYMRELEKGDPSINIDEMDKFINFHNFIELLELHTDDNKEMIVKLLKSDDNFLQLDFYYLYLEVLDKNGDEVNRYYLDETPNTDDLKPLSKTVKYTKFSYDSYEYDDPVSYPTSDFLDHLLTDEIDDVFIEMYWNIEDILKLSCMSVIGIDMKIFKECYEALFTDARTTLNFIRSKQAFNDKQMIISNNQNFSSEDNPISKPRSMIDKNIALSNGSINSLVEQKEQEISKLKEQLRMLSEEATKDKLLPYNSQVGVAKMLYAILTEHNYDLSATKGKTNQLIEKLSQSHGTSVTRNFIAQWIDLANQAKNDSVK